jgi:hypothetical protein
LRLAQAYWLALAHAARMAMLKNRAGGFSE